MIEWGSIPFATGPAASSGGSSGGIGVVASLRAVGVHHRRHLLGLRGLLRSIAINALLLSHPTPNTFPESFQPRYRTICHADEAGRHSSRYGCAQKHDLAAKIQLRDSRTLAMTRIPNLLIPHTLSSDANTLILP